MRERARSWWRDALRGLRAVPALSLVATVVVRWWARTFHLRHEWAIRHLHRVGLARARLPNGRMLRLWSRGDDWVSNQLFWRGWQAHEVETAPMFFRLAEKAVVTIDVGAYVGYFTLLAGHANPAGRVIALEPLPTIYERLTSNVLRNGLPNVECIQAAAGAADGMAPFFHQGHALPTSSSLSQTFMAGVRGLSVSTLPVRAIDGLLAERGVTRVDLVKIDTETTEPDVLAGMAVTLERDRPWIVCEVLKGRGAEGRLNALLAPLGYRYYLLTPQGPVARTVIEGHAEWLNYLFAGRPEALP